MSTLDDYLRFAEDVQKYINTMPDQELPLEAEIHAALVRNKLALILPDLRRIATLYPQLLHHYERIFACIDEQDGTDKTYGKIGK